MLDESGRTRGSLGGDQGGQRSLLVNDNTDSAGLALGNRNIAAEIWGRYPVAGLCCAIHLKFKCGSTKQPRQVSLSPYSTYLI